MVVNVGNILTGNAAVVVPTAAPSFAGISDMDLQAAFLARFGSVGVQNAGHYARNSGFFARQCVAKVTFTSYLWHVSHSVWNSLMHALHGNGSGSVNSGPDYADSDSNVELVSRDWHVSHRAWNRLMHALHGNTTMMGVFFNGVFFAASPIHFYPMMWHISHAAWNRLQHALHGNTTFFVPSILMLLIAVCMRAYYFHSELQVAFPAGCHDAHLCNLPHHGRFQLR